MLKKTIAFKDLDGNPVQRDFYFHIGKSNLVKLKLEFVGDTSDPSEMDSKLKKLMASKDVPGIIGMFDRILELAYGIRDEDGISFIQGPDVFRKFQGTDAYSELFMELIGSSMKLEEFIRGCLPAELAKQLPLGGGLAGVLQQASTVDRVSNVEVGLGGGLPHMPAPSVVQPREAKDYSEEELMEMSWDDFHKLFGRDVVAWDQSTLLLATNRKLKGK